MRVLWLTPGFAAHEQDFNCIPPLQLLAHELSIQNIELQIIAFEYPFNDQPYKWNDIPVISANGGNRRWPRFSNWLRVIRYAKRNQQQQKFDAIHSFWLGPAWLIGRYLAAQWGIPHYTTLMGQDVLRNNRYLHLLWPGGAQNLVALSNFQNDVFEKTSGRRAAHLIPWGVDAREIPAVLPDDRPIDILGCGSLIPLKNWDLWLNVVTGLVKIKPALRAELIGEGPERTKLENLIQQLDLQENVNLPGALPRPEVLVRMQQSKVLLHTARFESFGFVLAEAAMNGCKVVSTPVGIAPEMAFCGNMETALLQQIIEALNQAHVPPKAPFTISETAQKYLALYGA